MLLRAAMRFYLAFVLELEVARSESNCSSLSSRDFASAWVTTVSLYMATDGAGMAHTTAVVPPILPPTKKIGFARFTQVVLVLAGGVRTPGPPTQLRP